MQITFKTPNITFIPEIKVVVNETIEPNETKSANITVILEPEEEKEEIKNETTSNFTLKRS